MRSLLSSSFTNDCNPVVEPVVIGLVELSDVAEHIVLVSLYWDEDTVVVFKSMVSIALNVLTYV